MNIINKKDIHKENSLIKIRSKYILKQIFDNLKQIKLLQMIRYNKNIKNKLNINKNHYFIEYSKVIVELFPMEHQFGNFININDKYKSHYHIYFNDNNEEREKYSIESNENVSKINIIIDLEVKSLSKLFKNCECLGIINFIRFNRTDFKDMSNMFNGCKTLKKINLSKFNTNNVSNMGGMFNECSSLVELDLSNFNTINAKNMNRMFRKCSSLYELNISNFNTNNVTDMGQMFYSCS